MKNIFRLKGALVTALATATIFSGIVGNVNAKNIGIAFSGGGFKSVADQTAVTAGLLAELMRRDKTKKWLKDSDASTDEDSTESPLASLGLYKDVKSLSTISGGSWFTSYLAFSFKFRKMVEEMAKQSASSEPYGKLAQTFFDEYGYRIDDLKNSWKGKDANFIQKVFRNLKKVLETLGPDNILTKLVDSSLMFSHIGNVNGGTQSSWFSATEDILGDDINKMTLGSNDVQEWSKGKNWNIITSVTTPSPRTPANPLPMWGIIQPRSDIWVKGSTFDMDPTRLSYSTEFIGENEDTSMPFSKVPFVPALFSVVLGNEGSRPPSAPLPTNVYSVLKQLKISYTARYGRKWWHPNYRYEKTIEGMEPPMDEYESFANMPIVGPVAASSAAVGFVSVLPHGFTDLLSQGINLYPSVGFACKETNSSESFTTGQKLIDNVWGKNDLTAEDLKEMTTKKGVCNLLDGGATDPFGIATAIASGADEIFCVNAIPDLFTVDQAHFGAGPFKVYHIFDGNSPTDDVTLTFETNNNSLQEMKFRSIKVKTVKNIYFGIEEGKEITLHIFSVQSKKIETMPMVGGVVGSFKEIGVYIEDIMQSFKHENNKEKVDKMLDVLGVK